jgi:hypothetical protein
LAACSTAGYRSRVDVGKTQQGIGTGLSGFIRCRREASTLSVQLGGPAITDADVLNNTDADQIAAMRNEVVFQETNLKKRKLQAFNAGHLVASEMTGEFEKDMDEVDKARTKTAQTSLANKKLKRSKVVKFTHLLEGKTVFYAGGPPVPQGWWQADYIVQPDPTAPAPDVKFACCLLGSCLVTEDAYTYSAGHPFSEV